MTSATPNGDEPRPLRAGRDAHGFGCFDPAGTRIEVTSTEVDGRPVVAVRGEIDQTTADRLWEVLERAAEHGPPLVVDLSLTTFIDSSGIRVLIRAWRRMGEQPHSLIVRSASATARRVFEVTGVDKLLTVEPSDETR